MAKKTAKSRKSGKPSASKKATRTATARKPSKGAAEKPAGKRNAASKAGDEITFAVKTDNLFMLGAPINTTQPYGELLTPEDAWNIDSKLDDGKPGYGKILALYWNNECSSADTGVSANTNLNASYRVTDTRPQCALKFRFAF